ncbi:MAG TPA: hypothetical protein VMZ27_02005 [Candidatus Saccharimonadales bacterium]|nr:hypothetical protein [Candidatus Saccharimonadales bacterium]
MKIRLFSELFSTLLITALPLAVCAQDVTTKVVVEAQPQPPLMERLKNANISISVREIVRMSEAGTDPAVLQTYVENSNLAYTPRPDEIIYMHEHGLSANLISAMIQHGARLRDQVAQAAPQPAQAAPAPQPQPNPTYVAQQPAPTYVETPSYTYASPSVVYVPYSGSSYYWGGYGGYYGGYYPRPYFSLGFSAPRFGFGFPHFFGHGSVRIGGHFGGGFGHHR